MLFLDSKIESKIVIRIAIVNEEMTVAVAVRLNPIVKRKAPQNRFWATLLAVASKRGTTGAKRKLPLRSVAGTGAVYESMAQDQ